ncbi:MAG: GntR family transcriptional regulator [Thainema sp.]
MALSSQPAIQRGQSLYEQVYQALRNAILTGELAAGQRLVETQLAEWLSVSRTPLREALRQLQQEGLVSSEANGGLRVTTLSIADAIELYDCRIALEQLAVAEACRRATDEQLKQLEMYVAEAEQFADAQEKPSSSFQLLELDYQFHHLIAQSSGNQRLTALLEQLFDAMALLRIQTLQHNPNVLEIRLEHRQIYTAIATQDADAATEAIVSHLIASKQRVAREINDLSK